MESLSDELIGRRLWRDADVAPFEVVDVPFVTIGGGFGSLMVVDLLRVSGLDTNSIAVLTRNTYPHESYQFLARNSQIGDADRLRSDSSAMPDNPWGFPSFALREAAKGDIGQAFRVFGEPLWAEFFTPISGDVFAGTIAEADRIGWQQMTRFGQVRLVRPREGGGYFTLLTVNDGGTKRRVAFRSRYVHMAPGYGGAQFLPDLQEYRQKHNDVVRVVNAYENHEHMYLEAQRHPVTIVVRGSGIVASRILERLMNDREAGRSQTTIVHLFRNYPTERDKRPRPKVVRGFTQQPFNLSKGAFGGAIAEKIVNTEDPAERVRIMRSSAGTTTAKRRTWFDQIERGLSQGFYRQALGEIVDITPNGNTIAIDLDSDGQRYRIDADFIVDATGLQGGVRDQRILADLVDNVGVGQNPMGRILADRHFEITQMSAPPGRAFITGAMSMGNYFGPVDSFYGLQWAAWRVVDRMAEDGLTRRLGSLRSISQWFKRMRGVAP